MVAAIQAIVEPKTQADPELRSSRRYTNLSAKEVRQALLQTNGYQEQDLPAERTLRAILNRMNYRLKRIQKGKPLKKVPQTAIFANVAAAKAEARGDPESLDIAVDMKAKVALGDYSRGDPPRTNAAAEVTKAWDQDPPAKTKLSPLGILVLATGALTLIFG